MCLQQSGGLQMVPESDSIRHLVTKAFIKHLAEGGFGIPRYPLTALAMPGLN